MPGNRLPAHRFVLRSGLVWILMVVILVVLPDTLRRWVSLEIARVVGWAVACGVWVVVIEHEWKARVGVWPRFLLELVLWVGAALVAMWISEGLMPH